MRRLIIIALSTVFVIAVAVGITHSAHVWPFDEPTTGLSSPSAAEGETTEATPGLLPTPTLIPQPDPSNIASDPPLDDTSTIGGLQPTGKTTVVITYADWDDAGTSVEVGGYASVVEESGSCTLTLTKDEVSWTKDQPTLTDVSTTSCGQFLVPQDELSTGTWNIVLSYRSETSSGSSTSTQVIVP